ncbi:unnamed protein product [Cunninghamella echinulata]
MVTRKTMTPSITTTTIKKSSTMSSLSTLPKKSKTPLKRKSSINENNTNANNNNNNNNNNNTPTSSKSTINQSKSTLNRNSSNSRRTVTPKKRTNASSTTTTTITTEPETVLRKSKSTSARKIVTKDELAKMHALLEESRKEKQKLSEEMDGKEAVWERLVSAKESYALQVQDKQAEINQLQQLLSQSQQQVNQLESQLNHYHSLSMSLSTTTTDSSSTTSLSSTPSSPPHNATTATCFMNGMEQHYMKRIEKLDKLVKEWQQDAQTSHQKVQEQQRQHQAQMDQLRRDLAERDQATATMERECEVMKQTKNETILAYELTMKQWQQDHDHTLKLKEDEIFRLTNMIEELKSCHYLLPPTPNDDDDDDDDDDDADGDDTIYQQQDDNEYDNKKMKKMYSSRRRLEQQLEMTTSALDEVHQQQQGTLIDNEKLKTEINLLNSEKLAIHKQYQQLEKELEHEINDKRVLMEERDVSIQNQLKLEEELKDSQFTNERLEYQLGQLTQRLNTIQLEHDDVQDQLTKEKSEKKDLQQKIMSLQQSHDSLEQECSKLMDEMLTLEELSSSSSSSSSTSSIKRKSVNSTVFLKNEIDRLKQHIQKQQVKINDLDASHRQKIKQLHQDMHQLEISMEQKDFKIMELEELWQLEKRRTKQQQQQQQQQQHHQQSLPISPISETAPSPRFLNFGFLHDNNSNSVEGDDDNNDDDLFTTTSSTTTYLNGSSCTSSSSTKTMMNDNTSLYCEICESYGHDVIGCNNLIMMNDLLISNAKENIHINSNNNNNMMYCVNCDLFDTHSTEECPNQDETF